MINYLATEDMNEVGVVIDSLKGEIRLEQAKLTLADSAKILVRSICLDVRVANNTARLSLSSLPLIPSMDNLP